MLGIAVLGCGRIGRVHARNLSQRPDVRLIAVFDTIERSAQQLAAELHVTAAQRVEDLLGDERIGAVLIATPTETHVALLTAAVKAGKAVLCEKPVDLDLARARSCWQEIAAFEPAVMIGFNRRFDPSLRGLRERLAQGEIGKPELISITSRDPAPPSPAYIKGSGGLFRDMTIHDFDMARYLAGEIAEVVALGSNLVDPQIGELGDIDTCTVMLKSTAGALIQISNSRRCVYGYDQRVEAFGSQGMLRVENHRGSSIESWGPDRTAARDPVLHFFIERYQQAYQAEAAAFVAGVQGGAMLSPDFRDGIAALELAAAAETSLRTGCAVQVEGAT